MSRRKLLILMTLATCVIGFAAGCSGPRVVLMHPTGVMRAGPDVKGKVYVLQDGEWVLSKNRIRIPEGFYITDLEPE